MAKDYYDILGIPQNTSKEDIKRAYHILAHQFHPDKADGNEKRFKEINEAYRVLSGEKSRAEYDRQYQPKSHTEKESGGDKNKSNSQKFNNPTNKNQIQLDQRFLWVIVGIVIFVILLIGIANSHSTDPASIATDNFAVSGVNSFVPVQNVNNGAQEDPTMELNNSFICPENYSSAQAMTDGYAQFISAYSKLFPKSTIEDLEIYRYELLVSHSCNTTLKNILQDVQPMNQWLYFMGEKFGPQAIQFTNDTNVWSSYFILDGQAYGVPNEELIFNFYLQNVWTNNSISAEKVAQIVADSYSQDNNSKVIYKFTAPDIITKNSDYFIYSYMLYPQQNYGFVYITKISSIQNSVFSVTYSKKITDANSANLQNDINNWLLVDTKSSDGVSVELGNIGVDGSWISYLTNKQKS